MRHLKAGRKLNRTASHRRALLAALSTALIKQKRIITTTAKAKETRRIIEPIITRARNAFKREKSQQQTDIHSRRIVARFIRDKEAVKILFSEIAQKVGDRPGGYTRVLPLGCRKGDGAEMSVIELVDYNVAQDEKTRKKRAEGSKKAEERRKGAKAARQKETAPAKDSAVGSEAPASPTNAGETENAGESDTGREAVPETEP
ncbi:MAG: 50S ribosomal protein L17 [Bacteroidota bacterium]|nr:50S ribosomal protein L17 [Bacteroidota bacterium]